MNSTLTTAIFATVALAGSALASWVDFEPIESRSPDKKRIVTARFHNVTEWKNTTKTVPANGTMRYELTDAKSNSLWVSDIPIDSGFSSFDTPAEMFVSTNAWTAVRTHSSELLCFSPTGERTARLDILKTLLPGESPGGGFFSFSTAGRGWGQRYARHYFFMHHSRVHFVIRTYWDARLVVRLSDGKAVTPDEEFSALLLSNETDFVRSTLDAAAATPQLERASREAIRPVITAVHMTGRSQMREFINLLRRLETVPHSRGACSSSLEYKPVKGSIDPGCYSNMLLRQMVHLSLRRLGATPTVFPCVRLGVEGTEPWQWAKLPDHLKQREVRAASLEPGLSPSAVVDLIGAPDFVVLHNDSWEYDMDTTPAYTLTLTWGAEGVKTITMTRPALWQQENRRDLQMLY